MWLYTCSRSGHVQIKNGLIQYFIISRCVRCPNNFKPKIHVSFMKIAAASHSSSSFLSCQHSPPKTLNGLIRETSGSSAATRPTSVIIPSLTLSAEQVEHSGIVREKLQARKIQTNRWHTLNHYRAESRWHSCVIMSSGFITSPKPCSQLLDDCFLQSSDFNSYSIWLS